MHPPPEAGAPSPRRGRRCRHATTLDDLLSPRHVAVVGASDNPRRIGGRPLAYFIEQGFEGAVYPVNPNRDKVQGLDAFPSLSDVPGPSISCWSLCPPRRSSR